MTTIFLTSGTSWTVPADWNSADNSIEGIAGGGGGGNYDPENGNGGGGGGGGAYSKVTNLSLTPDALVTYAIGAGGGIGAAGGDTWFNGASLAASSVGAKGGAGGNNLGVGGAGGDAGAGVGATKFSGGLGGSAVSADGGGGGGAAGPSGAGGNGSGTSGGQGGNGAGGVGGAPGNGHNATPAGDGTEFDATHGSGGGGAGGTTGYSPSIGGLYGGGGGGGNTVSGFGALGKPGLIVITYTPGSGEPIVPETPRPPEVWWPVTLREERPDPRRHRRKLRELYGRIYHKRERIGPEARDELVKLLEDALDRKTGEFPKVGDIDFKWLSGTEGERALDFFEAILAALDEVEEPEAVIEAVKFPVDMPGVVKVSFARPPSHLDTAGPEIARALWLEQDDEDTILLLTF